MKLIDLKLTPEEKKVLIDIYKFQLPRRFRYGKRIDYIVHVGRKEEVIKRLAQKGLVFTISPYRSGAKYVLLTKKGRIVVEKLLDRC